MCVEDAVVARQTRVLVSTRKDMGSVQVGGSKVIDPFDVTLEDGDLMGEVELTTNLIVAASESDGPLSRDEIDRLLGVVPIPRQR